MPISVHGARAAAVPGPIAHAMLFSRRNCSCGSGSISSSSGGGCSPIPTVSLSLSLEVRVLILASSCSVSSATVHCLGLQTSRLSVTSGRTDSSIHPWHANRFIWILFSTVLLIQLPHRDCNDTKRCAICFSCGQTNDEKFSLHEIAFCVLNKCAVKKLLTHFSLVCRSKN